jgi:hypothetical protein
MKIAIFAFLMVVVLMFVESQAGPIGSRGRGGRRGGRGVETDTVDGMRLKRDLNHELVQRDLGNGQRRYIRDVNKKHHVHMSNERVPAARVARSAQTLKNVHERILAETEDAGK